MGRHSGSHHSSSRSHSGGHHRSSRSHSGGHHRSSRSSYGSSGNSSTHSAHYSKTRTKQYKYRSSCGGYYAAEDIPSSAKQYNGTWYSENGTLIEYDLNMDDPYVQERYDETKVTKLYRWCNISGIRYILLFYLFFFSLPVVWGICGSNILYELVIPIFENADMTDTAFNIIDDGLYNIQFIPGWLWTIGAPILTIKGFKKSKKYEQGLAKEIVDHYDAVAEMNSADYLSTCPGCGAAVTPNENGDKIKFCPYCGQNLRADGMQ